MISRVRTQLIEIIKFQSNFDRVKSRKIIINNRQIHFANDVKFYYIENMNTNINKKFLEQKYKKSNDKRFRIAREIKNEKNIEKIINIKAIMNNKIDSIFHDSIISIAHLYLQRISFKKSYFFSFDARIQSKNVRFSLKLSSIKNFYTQIEIKSRKSFSKFYNFIKILIDFDSTFNFISQYIVDDFNVLNYFDNFMTMIITNETKISFFKYIKVKIITTNISKIIQI